MRCWASVVAPELSDLEPGGQEPKADRRGAIDMTALRALRESRTDVEAALDRTAERLRRVQEVGTKMADDSLACTDRRTAQADADAVRPDDQQGHRPQQPGPHRGREAGH
ncbi:hypothetical protein ABZ202_12555 [Streptomyces sp. NPDC006186]|uniref:hypothetical protein n=1 Tax=Streptomyces sp. NPDC006186 TaxID=3155248 RepID=UPI0033B384A7